MITDIKALLANTGAHHPNFLNLVDETVKAFGEPDNIMRGQILSWLRKNDVPGWISLEETTTVDGFEIRLRGWSASVPNTSFIFTVAGEGSRHAPSVTIEFAIGRMKSWMANNGGAMTTG